MKATPFLHAPLANCVQRWFLASLGAYGSFLLCTGLVVNAVGSGSAPMARGLASQWTMWGAALQVQHQFWENLQRIPAVCWNGTAVSEFQLSQCDRYWNDFFRCAAYASAPVVALVVLWWLAWDQVAAFYRRTHKKILSGKADFVGEVEAVVIADGLVPAPKQGLLAPVGKAQRFFCWFFCLQAVRVKLADHKRVDLYLTRQSPTPQVGDRLAGFQVGWVFGASRTVGLAYTPHVAVIASN